MSLMHVPALEVLLGGAIMHNRARSVNNSLLKLSTFTPLLPVIVSLVLKYFASPRLTF